MLNISDQDLASDSDVCYKSDASVMNLNIQDSNNHNENNSNINNLFIHLNESIVSDLNYSREYSNTIDLNQSSQSCLTEKDEIDCNHLNKNTTIIISNNDQNFTEKLKCWAVEYKINKMLWMIFLEYYETKQLVKTFLSV